MTAFLVHWAGPQSGAFRGGMMGGRLLLLHVLALWSRTKGSSPLFLHSTSQATCQPVPEIPLVPGRVHAGSAGELWLLWVEWHGPDSRDMKQGY